MHRLKKTMASLSLALICGTACATPKDELHDAFAKFLTMHSFRATVTDLKKGESIPTLEFVAADRYRMKTRRASSGTSSATRCTWTWTAN